VQTQKLKQRSSVPGKSFSLLVVFWFAYPQISADLILIVTDRLCYIEKLKKALRLPAKGF
jgi:hypothetical protein